MSGLGIIGSLIIGGLAGWIASNIMKSGTGLIMNIILGIVGAMVANFLLSVIGLTSSETWMGQLIVGLAGACLLIWLTRKLR